VYVLAPTHSHHPPRISLLLFPWQNGRPAVDYGGVRFVSSVSLAPGSWCVTGHVALSMNAFQRLSVRLGGCTHDYRVGSTLQPWSCPCA
jgi:hypothetical protein